MFLRAAPHLRYIVHICIWNSSWNILNLGEHHPKIQIINKWLSFIIKHTSFLFSVSIAAIQPFHSWDKNNGWWGLVFLGLLLSVSPKCTFFASLREEMKKEFDGTSLQVVHAHKVLSPNLSYSGKSHKRYWKHFGPWTSTTRVFERVNDIKVDYVWLLISWQWRKCPLSYNCYILLCYSYYLRLIFVYIYYYILEVLLPWMAYVLGPTFPCLDTSP